MLRLTLFILAVSALIETSVGEAVPAMENFEQQHVSSLNEEFHSWHEVNNRIAVKRTSTTGNGVSSTRPALPGEPLKRVS